MKGRPTSSNLDFEISQDSPRANNCWNYIHPEVFYVYTSLRVCVWVCDNYALFSPIKHTYLIYFISFKLFSFKFQQLLGYKWFLAT